MINSSDAVESVVGVLERALGDPERERRASIVSGRDSGSCLLEHRTRLVHATRGDDVVEEAGEVAGTERLREVGEAQGQSPCADPDLRRNREHPGDAESDFCLLGCRQRLAERLIGERDRFLAVARDVQCDRRRTDDLPPSRVVGRCDLECALAESRGGIGVGRDQRLGGLEQSVDCHLVSRLGARGQLHRDFDRQCAGFEQNAGRLAIERTAGSYRHAGPDCLTCDVVPEGELLIALDE